MILASHSLAHLASDIGLIAGIVGGLGVIGYAAYKLYLVFDWVHDIWMQTRPNNGSWTEKLTRIDHNVQANARNNHLIYSTMLKMHKLDPGEAPLLESLERDPKDG